MNIYDVAKRAGVSTATVSRVINDSSKVSPKTQEKVRRVMAELNYTPSQIAVGLATNVTRTVGIMVPDVRDNFHATAAFLLENELLAHGYNCILCNTTGQPDKMAHYLATLYAKQVDGIVLVGSSYADQTLSDAYQRLTRPIPMVGINAVGAPGTYCVLCDEAHGMREALTHLRQQGRQAPAFLRDPQPYQNRASRTKEEAYRQGMKTVYGLEAQPLTLSAEPSVESYRTLLRQMKQEHPQVDAILCTNDFCCAELLKALQAEGIPVPERMALVGFNNSYITDLTSPTITTIDHHVTEHCAKAVEKLLTAMNGGHPDPVTYIQPHLVIKETT
ncbi:MAG: LacI family DNA-binding transcriptional regulator [Eubacteriales bacterium]|jgi:LacI family transcriptional regulator